MTMLTITEADRELLAELKVADPTESDQPISHPEPGHCRVCGCTDAAPCTTDGATFCWWVDIHHTLCSSPRCLAVVPLAQIEREIWP